MNGEPFEGDCDCDKYSSDRKLTEEESEIERLLNVIEVYEDWPLADKQKYHDFMIREITQLEIEGE